MAIASDPSRPGGRLAASLLAADTLDRRRRARALRAAPRPPQDPAPVRGAVRRTAAPPSAAARDPARCAA